jgi:hypothetical protein
MTSDMCGIRRLEAEGESTIAAAAFRAAPAKTTMQPRAALRLPWADILHAVGVLPLPEQTPHEA